MSKLALPIPSPQSSPLFQRGEADPFVPTPSRCTRLGSSSRSPRIGLLTALAMTLFCVTNCTTISSHEFSQPTGGWKTKTGQLMYRSPKTTLIGEALVRFSKTGDFELTVSKGPGNNLVVYPAGRHLCRSQRSICPPGLVWSCSASSVTAARLARVARSICSRARSENAAVRQRQRDILISVLSLVLR